MSWFDATGFASLAKSALNTAQKTIDKALDIKEDTIQNIAPTARKPDVDSFFESFGLGTKLPPTAEKKSVHQQPVVPSPEKLQPVPTSSSQNSGFWTDAWGSFFETKVPAPEPQRVLKATDTEPSTLSPKKTAFKKEERPTVSSQPQRASLFPGDVKHLSDFHPSSQVAEQSVLSGKDEVKSKLVSSEPTSRDASESTQCDSVPANEISSTEPSEKLVPLGGFSTLPAKVSDEEKNASLLCDTTQHVPKLCNVEDKNASTTTDPNANDVIKADSRNATHSNDNENVGDGEKCSVDLDKLKITEAVGVSEVLLHETNVPQLSSVDPCPDISESYVNLESSILNKSAFVKMSDSVAQGNMSVCDTQHSPTTSSVTSQNVPPVIFTDSFHVINDSVLHNESMWVIEMSDRCTIRDSEDHQSRSGDTGSSSSKDDCEIDMKDCDVKSSGSCKSQEMTSSFVKCSIDDLEESCHRGQSPLSTTTSERSDITKLESEQNTSGDENETTTSSDIEILSPPNGENGERNTSPLKHIWIPRTLRLRDSESPASDCSKESMIPSAREDKDFAGKRYEGIDLDKVFQQQEELQALLEAREKRIMELSTENLKLHESEEKLQNQVCELKLSIARESQNMSSITKDLTQRLAQIENQAQKAAKERDTFKKQLEEAQTQLAQRVTVTEMDEIVKEKDQQVKELMEEGQKLSKKELQHTTIIKKLRAKEDEMEHSMKSLKEKLEENSKEVERLRKSMGAKDDQEKKHIDAIRQLSNTVNKQEKEIAALKSNLEDCKEKELSTKRSLDSTYKELMDLRKQCAVKDKEIKELQLSVEMAAKEKLREGLDQASKEANREKEALFIQMEDLRKTLKRCEEEANQREKALKEDISRLQLRLQEAESRNEELTKNISTCTRPLVRQIETLQASYNAQISSWEKVEKNLSDRLSDTQNQLAISSAREKLANEKYEEISSKLIKLETDNNRLNQEKLELSTELEVISSKLAILEDSKNRNYSSLDTVKNNLTLELNRLKDEKDKIAKELENCVELLKEERVQNQNLREELRTKNDRLHANSTSPCPSPSASLRSSVDSINNLTMDDNQERRVSTHLNNYRLSLYDSLSRTGCTTSLLESLQSQLKQREGEISQLQCQITKLEGERESVAQELVEVATQNEELLDKLEKLKSIEKLHKDLSQKYNALLQMYNEKVDEYEALLLDLADVKSAYRRQIEELLQNK